VSASALSSLSSEFEFSDFSVKIAAFLRLPAVQLTAGELADRIAISVEAAGGGSFGPRRAAVNAGGVCDDAGIGG
jgi:hypothetical protein